VPLLARRKDSLFERSEFGILPVNSEQHCSGGKKAFWLLFCFGKSNPPEAKSDNRKLYSHEIKMRDASSPSWRSRQNDVVVTYNEIVCYNCSTAE